MPARNSSMELSSPSNPDVDQTLQSSRRRSGRVSKVPHHLGRSSPLSDAGAKRKRSEANAEDSDSDSEDTEMSDGEPDEEEVREKKRKAKKTKVAKQAPSRTKVNGLSGSLPVRNAPRAKKTKKVNAALSASAAAIGGLYGELFGKETDVNDITVRWKSRFDQHQANAVAEIVNLLLRASGCEVAVDHYDIEDPDNAPNRLVDIQQQFQAEKLSDYPIISKSKGAANFKKSLVSFFEALVQTLAGTGLLYNDADLLENIQCWVGAMSSAAHRPFRHTATVVALAIMDGLCEVGRSLTAEQAKLQRQCDGEEKKSKPNQARLKDFRQKAKAETEHRSQVDVIVKDWSDTVYVHRYRDVDPKIRADCVIHLSNWIVLYPDVFFDGQHLRYLGWLLSDPSPQIRLEVLKQLQKFYRDQAKLAGLQQFTERFRPRVVEMATLDAEPNVRVSAIETIDAIRDAGLLEPDDIDTVGRLVYDADPRIRRAVVPFFASCVSDSYDDKISDLGGIEALEESVPAIDEDNDTYAAVRTEWLKLKALAELLRSFDPEDVSLGTEHDARSSHEILIAAGGESRFSMATRSFIDKIPELSRWQVLAGYLLFDNTQGSVADNVDMEAQLKSMCTLDEKEEALLLEVLNEAVKASLEEVLAEGRAARKSKKDAEALRAKQEKTAQDLASMIPELLKKFGSISAAASAVLRLQRFLNLDLFQELRQDTTKYATMLDDIQKQFMSHESKDVVCEASNALLHARSFQSVEDVTSEKLRSIWDETAYALIQHCLGEDLELRGGIDPPTLVSIASTVLRIASLARVTDCIAVLETPQTYVSKQRRKKSSNIEPQRPVTLLLALLARGRPASNVPAEVDAIEDELVSDIITALIFYFFWYAKTLRDATEPREAAVIKDLLARREAFSTRLHAIVATRNGFDKLRIHAAEALLDLYSVFSVQTRLDESASQQQVLFKPIPASQQATLLNLFAAAEKDYSKRAGKKLEEPAEDEEPEDISDSESDDGSDDEAANGKHDEAETQRRQAHARNKQEEKLLAEDRLCRITAKMVLAILTGVADPPQVKRMADGTTKDVPQTQGPMRKRLARNKAHLGANFKEVLAALEQPVEKKGKGKKKEAAPATSAAKAVKSKEFVEDDDDDEDEDDDAQMRDVDDEEEQLRRGGHVSEEVASRRDIEVEEDEGGSPAESVVGD